MIAQTGQAGMSSENVVVVVNGDSLVSRTIANHYTDLRQVPSKNIVVLDGIPDGIQTDLETFRERILRPLLKTIDERGISATTRVIAYSAGFPTAVRINEHTALVKDETTKRFQTPVASITGLTYFYKYVLADQPGYLSFASNLYARGKFKRHFVNPFSNEKKERFAEAERLNEEDKYAESAAIWKELHESHPTMPALAIRAAENYSLADQKEEAIEFIKVSLKSGWWSARYLRDQPELASLLDDPKINWLLPFMDQSPTAWQGVRAFSASNGWTVTGAKAPLDQGAIPYLCSCSLAVVTPHGSTLGGAVRNLRRSASSDRTFPKARFAYGAGSGVRAKTRFPGVADAIVHLQENKFETEIFRGSLPTKPGPICGLMVGAASVDLLSQGWQLVPGAIAENLTSFGGKFDSPSQTKLTEFLTRGAAMSSGAVAEPYSLQFKFPTPMLYAYYAQGTSTIEAFYSSVSSPYQLLIVGDPLAQPFAKAPDEVVDVELRTDGKRRLRISRRTLGLKIPKTPTASIEVSINDRLFQITPAVPNIDVNWPDNTSGIFDIRTTLTGLHQTEPRVTFLAEIDVQGEHQPPVAEIESGRTGIAGDRDDGSNASSIKVAVSCEGADRIEVEHWGQTVATVEGQEGIAEIESNRFGGGPLRLRPIAYFGEQRVQGKTIVDHIDDDK